MSESEITVLRDPGVKLPAGLYPTCLPFQELREQIVKGSAWKHLFAYRLARLYTHRIDLLSKPFNTAILLRLLSHGACLFQDETGQELRVDSKVIAGLFVQWVRDALRKKSLLREVGDEVESLIPREPPPKKPVVSTGPPLYLRTDLAYGLRSGGSVGHIAGVLNNLGRFTGQPIFVTTDRIPTVDESVETMYCGLSAGSETSESAEHRV